MKRILIWDLPVRLFHWIFALAFIAAFAIALSVDDDAGLFPVHMLLGGIMTFMVLLRVVWGFTGTRWARFETFIMKPGEILVYLVGAITGKAKRYAGHNPGSSLAAYLMFAILVGLAITGIMMGNGAGGSVEELHELLAWSMAIVVIAHLLGLLIHTVRHRENISRSMIDGRKIAEPADAIASARPVIALVFLALTALWTIGLINGFDSESGKLEMPVVGTVLELEHEHHH